MSSPPSEPTRSPSLARLACATPAFVERATPTELEDWLSYFDPNVVVLTGTQPAPRAANAVRRQLDPETMLFEPAGGSMTGPRSIDGVQFVFASKYEYLASLPSAQTETLSIEQPATLSTKEPTFVLSNLLALDVDKTALSTTLVGRKKYADALESGPLGAECIHISTALPAGYRREWNGLTVLGGGRDAGEETPLVTLDCRSDGEVLTRELNPGRLGLRALHGVGNQRARLLRDAGYDSRESVARAELSNLVEVSGLGKSTAMGIKQSARAVADSEIVRQSETPLPKGDPVYIDIETDGLSPTITWLIGVLDGSAADGEYLSFLQTDPDEPGGAIEEFMAWYTANASHRPLVAYNGWNFDFTVLHDHILEYCPQYEEAWTSSYRFDPYQWAVEKGNAHLPGRTNKLEDVARALGYERTERGVTGRVVARIYQQWMIDYPKTSNEPDWERFASYCEDDVRALATVYEALEASGRIVSRDGNSRDTEQTTMQGTLSDW